MNTYTFNPKARTITNAKLARRLPKPLASVLLVLGIIGSASGIVGFAIQIAHAALIAGVGLLVLCIGLWLRGAVIRAKPAKLGTTTELAELLPTELLGGYHPGITATDLLAIIGSNWQSKFILGRFGLDGATITAAMAGYVPDQNSLITNAGELATSAGADRLNVAAILVALINGHPASSNLLTAAKLSSTDLMAAVGWISRLENRLNASKPIYGGIARDWAAGFTPTLSQFAVNMSRQIESVGGNFSQQERTTQLDNLVSSLESATGSVVLVGETGIGKTALLYGLAERLLRGEQSKTLRHNQIFALSASSVLSRVTGSGDLERIVLTILSEAIGAGNIVVALDEAQLFFGQGAGAVNLSQILLPIVQSRRLKLILTLTPGDWQRLRSTNVALSSLLTPIILSEPDEASTLELLADRALMIENNHFTTYQALRQAYALSDRYITDEANPGRSLKLLESSLNFPDGMLISAASVEQAVESQFGVKVRQADAAETDTLLHLEDHIHQRMINQTRAVSVVASALRRARAGVANPKRPIGSFLFLGPTGVGKTELARSLAALYFGSESSMIRLDMSEYQQPADVSRLLASAAENPQSLLARVKQQPFCVVLFDEIEKANPNILNLLLQLLDEGNLTDTSSRPTSFKDAIIIATSNAGADEIRAHIQAGEELESFEKPFIDQLITSGSFKPELLNRFDEIVLFRPLNQAELGQVVGIMVTEVNHTLEPQKVTVELTPAAVIALVAAGYDPRLGARPMRRMVQRTVEDAVAGRILRGQAGPGTVIKLDTLDLNLPASPAA